MRLTVLWVAKTKESHIKKYYEYYEKLLRRHAKLKIVELPEGKFSKGASIAAERKKESVALCNAIPKDAEVWYLDVKGELLSTEEFSKDLEALDHEGQHLCLMIGGAYGVDDEILDGMIHKRLSISPMTMSHQLIRVVLFEQLYRALDYAKGGKYHHG